MPGGDEQNSVNQFSEDKKGQMWIATKDGLIRYNGKDKFIYKSDPENPNSIWHNFVTKLLSGKDGNLWVGTQKGLSEYRPETDDFIAVHPDLNNQYITDIQQDNNGIIWIVNHIKNRLYSFNPANGKLKLVSDNDMEDEQGKIQFLWILIDSKQRFFIVDQKKGFIRFFPKTKSFKRITLIDKKTEEKYGDNLKRYISNIIQDRKNPDILWVGTNFGFLIKYNLLTNKQERIFYNTKLSNHGFHCYNSDLYQDKKQNIWITTWFYGTFKILPDRKTIIRYLPDPDNKYGISNTITTAIYQDKAGYLWFGTECQGIDILKKNKKFKIFPKYPPVKGCLPAANYTNIIEDNKNKIWISAEGGIYTLDKKTMKSKKQNKLFKDATRFFSLCYDNNNRLWAGTEKGLFCINEKGETVYRFTYDKDDYQSISCNYISDIKEDKSGNFWIGTFCAGMVKYNTKTKKFYRFTPDKSDPKSISHKYVTDIFIDKDNEVWVGTEDGLNKLNSASGNFTVYKNDKTNPETIGSSVINDINETEKGIWIATQGGGLNLFDKKTQTFKSYLKKNGLPDNNIKAILTDNNGNLWFSSTKNIIKFNPETEQTVIYTKSDGLDNRLYVQNLGWRKPEFTNNLAFKDKNGYMYFGGSGGIVGFHPDSLVVNTHKSPLIIDNFLVNGKKINPEKAQIILEPYENQFNIEFTLLNLIQPEKNKYAWKLVPYDKIKHKGNYTAKASYFNLPSGSYKLYYEAVNNDGILTKAPEPLQITIKPHFYRTLTFYLFLSALFLLIIFAFFAYRRYLKIQIKKKRELLRYTSSNLSENFINNLNTEMLQLLENKKQYLEPELSLQKLAVDLKTKPNYLSQVINRKHNCNFRDFINKYRIKTAKKLLIATDLKIEAVAYDSGFNTLSTFNAVFKKETGTTPSKYRSEKTEK